MLMRRSLVLRTFELGVRVVVLGAIVGVRVRRYLQRRIGVVRTVAMRMHVSVPVSVPMPVRMRVAMHQVAVAMRMVVHMLVSVRMLVVMRVLVGVRVVPVRRPGIVLVGMIVGKTFAVGHDSP